MTEETESRILGAVCFVGTPAFAILTGYASDMGWDGLAIASFLSTGWCVLGVYASGAAFEQNKGD